MTELKKNRTRRTNKNLTANGNTVFYLNTNTSNNSNISSASFYSNWESIPKESIDVIWSQHCPYLGPFFKENIHDIFNGTPLLEEGNPSEIFWKTSLENAHRILKPGGSFILPLKPVWDGFLTDPNSILYTFRIINQEVYPHYLYRVKWVSSLYKLPFFIHSTEYNLFEKHTSSKKGLVHVDKWGFIVIQKREEEE